MRIRSGQRSVLRPSRETEVVELEIEKIVPGGLGLARHGGQVAFVPCTVPGDRIRGAVIARHRHHLMVHSLEILSAGADSVDPGCFYFGHCGGCQLRRLSAALHDRIKTDFVREGLTRIARLEVDQAFKPLIAADLRGGYRRRAGFKVEWNGREVLLGFFAGGSNEVVDLATCPILDPRLTALLSPLRHLIGALSVKEQISAVDGVVGDKGMGLVFYLSKSFSPADKKLVSRFAQEVGAGPVWFQVGLKNGLQPLVVDGFLSYKLDGFEFFFQPGDFIQAHATQNQHLVAEAMRLSGEGERGWDLFCGVGNFTLSLSRQFQQVNGVEIALQSVQQAEKNRIYNAVAESVVFQRVDLFDKMALEHMQGIGLADLVLLDPPRTGADRV